MPVARNLSSLDMVFFVWLCLPLYLHLAHSSMLRIPKALKFLPQSFLVKVEALLSLPNQLLFWLGSLTRFLGKLLCGGLIVFGALGSCLEVCRLFLNFCYLLWIALLNF